MALTESPTIAPAQPSHFLHTGRAVIHAQNTSLCTMNVGLTFRLWFLAIAAMLGCVFLPVAVHLQRHAESHLV